MNAFILAAGYGERLRPITDYIPKPLLPILGRPVIEIVLDRISSLSPEKIGINMHHQWEKIRAFAETSRYSERIELFYEGDILGTGGALFNARSLLKEYPCVVHNADILTDIDLQALTKKHIDSNHIATLAVHDYVKFNNVWLDTHEHLKYVGRDVGEKSGVRKVAFMGVAVYSPEFLSFLPEGRSSIVDAWLRAVNSGRTIGTLDYSGAKWSDIGTPDAYAETVFDTLAEDGEVVCIHNAVDCSRIELGIRAVIEEGASVSGKAFIRNSILLPGAVVPENQTVDNAIAGPGFTVSLGQTQPVGTLSLEAPFRQWFGSSAGSVDYVPVSAGGSDRVYYRVSCSSRTAILMKCTTEDPDYERHIAYSRFFRDCSLPVPEILAVDVLNKQALFEDLGDISLYSWLKCNRSQDSIEAMYRTVLDMLVTLHAEATAHLSECPLIQRRVFDYDHLRWETEYFLDRFVLGIKEISRGADPALLKEFDNLAGKVDAYHKTIVHRDFQAQNIMIVKGDIPRLIDYQGARIGPPAYDVVSMLWDPYIRMDDSMRDRLLNYYIGCMKGSGHDFDAAEFSHSLLPCRLQRHMQALGAYGFLSKVKGKRYFLKHAEPALEYLKEEAALAREDYPTLYDLVTGIE